MDFLDFKDIIGHSDRAEGSVPDENNDGDEDDDNGSDYNNGNDDARQMVDHAKYQDIYISNYNNI